MNSVYLRLCLSIVLAAPFSTSSAAPISWRGHVEIADGPGEKGPWEQNNSRYHYVDDPTVTLDRSGNMDVAWVDQTRKDVFFQKVARDGAVSPTEPINVSRSPATFSWLPRIERGPDAPGRLYLLWQEIIFSGGSHGGDILVSRSDDDGATFSPPVNVSSSIGGDGKGRINAKVWHNGSQDLVAGLDGALYLAWTEYDGPLWFSHSNDGGKSFSPPQTIARGANAKPARAPSIAIGKDNTLHLAWTTGEDEGADIHLASSRDGGKTFGAPRTVAPDDRYSDSPKLAVTPDGVLHLVYAKSSAGPFAEFRIVYTQSSDNGQTFAVPRSISSPLPGAARSAHFPSLAADAHGRIYVIYEMYPTLRGEPRGLGMSVSTNGGKTFSVPVAVPDSVDAAGGTNGSHQGRLMKKLAVNRDGQVAIVNSSLDIGRRSRVWLIHGEVQAAQPAR